MPTDDYQIRCPLVSDREQWDVLWQGYLTFYESSLATDITNLLWQRIHDSTHETQCRVAVASDNSLVGFVMRIPGMQIRFATLMICL